VVVIIARWSEDGEDMQGILTDICSIQVGFVQDEYLGCIIDTSRVHVLRNDPDKVVIEHLPSNTKIVSFKSGDPSARFSKVVS
jgi:hypothetical protein